MSLVILTGASGAGKTTITKQVASQLHEVICLYFDSIGVPSTEEMIAKFGSSEEWQKAITLEWIKKIHRDYPSKSVLFEGQARIAFIKQALKQIPSISAEIILIDCDDETRKVRLVNERNQSELANEQMMGWAKYLRDEAKTENIKILDTSRETISDSVKKIIDALKA